MRSSARQPLRLVCLPVSPRWRGARGESRTHKLSLKPQVLSLLRLPFRHSSGGKADIPLPGHQLQCLGGGRRSRSPDLAVRSVFETVLVLDQFTPQGCGTGESNSAEPLCENGVVPRRHVPRNGDQDSNLDFRASEARVLPLDHPRKVLEVRVELTSSPRSARI